MAPNVRALLEMTRRRGRASGASVMESNGADRGDDGVKLVMKRKRRSYLLKKILSDAGMTDLARSVNVRNA